jgi:hypothetical protein
MSTAWKPYEPDQLFLLPPSLTEWLPQNHLAYFISDVVDELDLHAIEGAYSTGLRGQYHPAMNRQAPVLWVLHGRSLVPEDRTEDLRGYRLQSPGRRPSSRRSISGRNRAPRGGRMCRTGSGPAGARDTFCRVPLISGHRRRHVVPQERNILYVRQSCGRSSLVGWALPSNLGRVYLLDEPAIDCYVTKMC